MMAKKTIGLLVIIGLIYILTLPKGIGFGDAGTLAAAAVSLGIPHPPGFPTFILLGHVFSKIPVGTELFRLQLLGVVGALGLVGVIGVAESWPTAVLVAALYGVWSQTGNIESYLLTNMFIFAIVLLKTRVWIKGVLLGIASGLNPIGIVTVPAIIIKKQESIINKLLIFGLAVVIGTLIYSYLPIRAAMHPFLNWGDPETPAALFQHLTGGGLNINSPTVVNGFVLSPKWILDAILRLAYLALIQLNIVLIFSVWGAISLYQKNKEKFWTLAILLIFNLLISGIYVSGNRDLWLTTSLIVLVIFAGYTIKKWLWLVAFVGLFSVNLSSKTALSSQYLYDLYTNLPTDSILIGGGETFNALSLYEYLVVKNKNVLPVDMTIFYGQSWYRSNLKFEILNLKLDTPTFSDELEFSRVLEQFASESGKPVFVTGYLLTTPVYANSAKPAYIPQKYQLVQHGLVYQLVSGEISPPLVPPLKLRGGNPKGEGDTYLESNYQKAADQIAMEYALAYANQGDFFKASLIAPKYFDQNKLKNMITPVPSDK